MPAATSAPNAITRMTSVIGSESWPAFARSSANAVSTASSALASPNSPMKNSGWTCWRRRLGRGPGRSCPRRRRRRRGSRTRRAPRARSSRSGPRSPGRAASARSGRRPSVSIRATTSSITAANAGSVTRSESLWMRTLSPAGCLKPASRILSIRPDSPGPARSGRSTSCRPSRRARRRRRRTRASRTSRSSSGRRSSDPSGPPGCAS